MGAMNIILGLAVLAVISSVSESLKTCPDGWIEWEGSCYIHKHSIDYKIRNSLAKGNAYESAVNVCNGLGGYLLELDSKREAKFVVNVVLHDATADANVWCTMEDGRATCGGDHGNYYDASGSRGFWEWDTPYWPQTTSTEECVILRKSNPPKIRSHGCDIPFTYACERGTGFTCPEGWTQFQGSCYIGVDDIDYRIRFELPIKSYYNRAGADAVCEAVGGHVLDVDSKEEAEFVVTTVLADATADAHLSCRTIGDGAEAKCDSGNFYTDEENQRGFWDWDAPYWPHKNSELECVILRTSIPPKIRSHGCDIAFTYACERPADKI